MSVQKSTTITALAKAMATFQGKIKAVAKDSTNPFFKSKYASLDNIWSNIRAPLSQCGLAVLQFVSGENEMTTILTHESGEFIEATCKMTPKNNTPQEQGSAITYMRRYALSAALGIVTDDDDDGSSASIAPPPATKPIVRTWTNPKVIPPVPKKALPAHDPSLPTINRDEPPF